MATRLLQRIGVIGKQVDPGFVSAGVNSPAQSSASFSREAIEAVIPNGTLLARRYRVLAFLGRGGTGAVYRAEDLVRGDVIAIKVIDDVVARDRHTRNLLLDEVDLIRRIDHPGVLRTFRAIESEDQLFFVMQCVDGVSLADRLMRDGLIPLGEALTIARELCSTLAAAHENGVLHRDLKPANVLLGSDGRVFLSDFGMARPIEAADRSEVDAESQLNGGTPAYMAPEQLLGRGTSIQSDLFALGLLLYELFTGKPAFSARTLSELVDEHARRELEHPLESRPDLPPAVAEAIAWCLAHEVSGRPNCARDLNRLIQDDLRAQAPGGRRAGFLASAGILIATAFGVQNFGGDDAEPLTPSPQEISACEVPDSADSELPIRFVLNADKARVILLSGSVGTPEVANSPASARIALEFRQRLLNHNRASRRRRAF